MVSLPNRLEEISSEEGLQINRGKTKIMGVTDTTTSQITNSINGLQVVDDIIYLELQMLVDVLQK